VLTLIDLAVVDVRTILGTTPPDYLADAAKSTATLKAAMYVELSYYPEQVRSDRSRLPRLVGCQNSGSAWKSA
jgi:hypothetical protein